MDLDLLFEDVLNEDFEGSEEKLETIIEENDSLENVKRILTFMEKHPDVDYGMPGPLVHYIERFFLNGYEELLYDSVKNNPTEHTLWMLNRIINSPKLINRDKYLTLMKGIAVSDNVSKQIRSEAKLFLNYQNI
ncbi:hypothetical protein SAMN05216351_106137 [Pseudobutyrivibrio sp. JW11]|uniref:hypothetical protein n=1 Tax=Pseudobutyrivibrio sp. JW11 TaxID=1855302 RepID=UPI0008EA1464|nr:hypothetical protein [Pseudobutyrivibrio sp. JW11]SFO32770.1 hypothetical protein SAMN05216351_106137 [Pseudobutyrivibrio sp. JW11]